MSDLKNLRSFGPAGWKTYMEPFLTTSKISLIEEDAIWVFIYEKIHNPLTGKAEIGRIDMQQNDTWLDFKKEFKSARPVDKLKKHFEVSMVPNLQKARMPGEAMLELYYALQIPIAREFLNRVRAQAVVQLDEVDRVIFVQQYGKGGFELGGGRKTEAIRNKIASQDKELWNYLLHKVHDKKTGRVTSGKVLVGDTAIWKEFIVTRGLDTTAANLMHRFLTYLAPNLHIAPLDFHSTTKLYFALEIPVEKSFLERLRKVASVALDGQGCIVSCFGKKDCGIALSRLIDRRTETTASSAKNLIRKPAFTEEEEIRMWVYMYGRIRDAKTHIIRKNYKISKDPTIWEDFSVPAGIPPKPSSMYFNHFRTRLVPNLHRARLEKQTKVALYYGLQIPVNLAYLKELKEEAIIEMATNGCIHTYRKKEKRKNPTQSVETIIEIDSDEAPQEKKPRVENVVNPKDIQEEADIWMSILEGFRENSNREVPLDSDTFFKLLVPNLHNANLDDLHKLELYQYLKMPVNPWFLEKARESIHVEVNEGGYVLSYHKKREDSGEIREVVESIVQKLMESGI